MERTVGPGVVLTENDICDINPTSISRSIVVTGFLVSTKCAEELIIHFQRKRNGGGDIDSITVSKKGTAVITFDKPEVVTSVLQHDHKFKGVTLKVEPYLDSKHKNDDQQFEVFEVVSATLCLELVESLSRKQSIALLETIAPKTGVNWIDSGENLIMSGTFKAVEESRALFQQSIHQSYGIVVVNAVKDKKPQERDDNESHFDVSQTEVEEDVNQKSLELAVEGKRTDAHVRTNVMDTGDRSSITTEEVQSYEIQPKIVKVFVRAHKKDLDDIETEFQVEIPRQADGKKIRVKPKETCSAEGYDEACNRFINLYQQMYQRVKMERFSLKSEKLIVRSREAISRAGKMFPVSIELSKDRKHYELYGEESHIAEALQYLEEEGVEIKNETKNTIDSHATHKKPGVNEEAMDVDPAEYPLAANLSGNRLETLMGKVKVSVYKGDITTEEVDVIVNAANEDLQHVGGIAKAILVKGGKSIEEESWNIIKRRGKLRDGDAVITNPGNLPCRAVVHAVGPQWRKVGATKSKEILRHACLNSFFEAERWGMASIALPAIGSGIYGVPKNVCAEIMLDAVDEFIRQGDPKKKTITDIRLLDIDDPSVLAFRKEFIARYPNCREVKANVKVSTGMSKPGIEGGSSTAPSFKSNRGKKRGKKNPKSGPSTTNPIDTSGGSQHHHIPHAASSANDDHPLRETGQTYSGAVKAGNIGGNDARHQSGGDGWRDEEKTRLYSAEGDAGDKTDKKEEDVCSICLDKFTNPRSLKCKHRFCSECLQQALNASNKCPVCQEPQGVLKGNQPHGEMTTQPGFYSLPGFEGCGTIIINYYFPPGIQGPEHPNPGQRYGGTSRTAYLPDSRKGREVLQLLKRAFDARLVFTVGTSTTTGLPNQITWNDIHHKTNIRGGPTGFGYPDPDYLRRVKEELAAKGIR